MNQNSEVPDILRDIMPEAAARHFFALTRIPRPSGHEGGVRRLVSASADRRGLTHREDRAGNIAVHLPAISGYEQVPHIVNQVHMDMVCESIDSTYVPELDSINLERTGDFLHSAGHRTTLGADDGMGLSLSLALLEETKLVHGQITLLCTAGEEKGMTGASELDPRIIPFGENEVVILNADSEDGAHVAANGSAGGARTFATLSLAGLEEAIRPDYELYTVTLSGLEGGHSGFDIHRGHGNAIVHLYKTLNELFTRIPQAQLVNFDGGGQENALPNEAHCTIAVPCGVSDILQNTVESARIVISASLGEHGQTMNFSSKKTNGPEKTVITNDTRRRLFSALNPAIEKDGVVHAEHPQYPLVSTNTGILKIDEGEVYVGMLSRSAVTHKDELIRIVTEIQQSLLNAGFVIDRTASREYDGWQEPDNSYAVRTVKEVHRHIFGAPITMRTYHAGVEVPTIADVIKEATGKPISSVCIGPRIEHAHSTNERLHIPSVRETYRLLKAFVEHVAKENKA